MSDITEFPGVKIEYKSPLPVSDESEGAIFTVNGDSDVSVSISNDLTSAWQIADVKESLKEIAPLFLTSRAHRGIMADNYTLTPESFTVNNRLPSWVEVKNTLLKIANSDWH